MHGLGALYELQDAKAILGLVWLID